MLRPPNTERFTGLAEKYARSRAGYPTTILPLLRSGLGLPRDFIVADIGAGTGILSKLFLDAGNTVYGVEPNEDMRKAAVQTLSAYHNFKPVAATAESTSLPDQSVDLVTIGQALHLFDIGAARDEFRRILRHPASVALVWNFADLQSQYYRDYKAWLRDHGVNRETGLTSAEDAEVAHETRLKAFFAGPYEYRLIEHRKDFTWENYLELMESSSELPRVTDPRHGDAVDALRILFTEHERNDVLTMMYHARVYFGTLDAHRLS